MKLLLTGSAGFIGSVLDPKLQKDYDVCYVDLKDGQDLLTCHLPKDVSYVVHLAALAGVRQSFDRAQDYWNVNVLGTKRILETYPNSRVLVASSSNAAFPYLNPYAMSKRTMEEIPHSNRLNMRFTTVYGPNSREGMFFNKLQNGTLEYTTNHIRDFIHVDDLTDIIVELLTSKRVNTINVGTGVGVRVSDLAPDLPVRFGEPYEVYDNTVKEPFWKCRTVFEYLEERRK